MEEFSDDRCGIMMIGFFELNKLSVENYKKHTIKVIMFSWLVPMCLGGFLTIYHLENQSPLTYLTMQTILTKCHDFVTQRHNEVTQ